MSFRSNHQSRNSLCWLFMLKGVLIFLFYPNRRIPIYRWMSVVCTFSLQMFTVHHTCHYAFHGEYKYNFRRILWVQLTVNTHPPYFGWQYVWEMRCPIRCDLWLNGNNLLHYCFDVIFYVWLYYMHNANAKREYDSVVLITIHRRHHIHVVLTVIQMLRLAIANSFN